MRGLIVGEVRGIATDRRRARGSTLALKPETVDQIPADVIARLLPKTLFGEQYVALVAAGGGPPAQPIRDGRRDPPGPHHRRDRARAGPRRPAAAAAHGAAGRSSTPPSTRWPPPWRAAATRLGENLELVDGYLTQLNPQLPALQADISGLADAGQTPTPTPRRTWSRDPAQRPDHDHHDDRGEAGRAQGALRRRPGFANTTARLPAATTATTAHPAGPASAAPRSRSSRSTRPSTPAWPRRWPTGCPSIDGASRRHLHITLETCQPAATATSRARSPRCGEKRGPHCYGLPDRYGSQANPVPGIRPSTTAPTAGGNGASSALPSAFLGRSGAGIADVDSGLAGTEEEQQVVAALLSADGRRAVCRSRPCSSGPMAARSGGEPAMKTDRPRAWSSSSSSSWSPLLATGVLAATIANVQLRRHRRPTRPSSPTPPAWSRATTSGSPASGSARSRRSRDRLDRTRRWSTFSVAKTQRAHRGHPRHDPLPQPGRAALHRAHPGGRRRGRAAAGATIPARAHQPALDLTVLFNGFKPLFRRCRPRTSTSSLRDHPGLQGEGGTLESLLAHTASLTSTLADRDQVIGRTDRQPQRGARAPSTTATTQLTGLIDQLQRFVGGLAEDRKAIGGSLDDISALPAQTADLVDGIRAPLVKDDIAELRTARRATSTDEQGRARPGPRRCCRSSSNKIGRTATYGSWFNFYLCQLRGHASSCPATARLSPVDYNTGSDRRGLG